MIQDDWQRVGGIHVDDAGDIAAVWLARNPDDDVIHV